MVEEEGRYMELATILLMLLYVCMTALWVVYNMDTTVAADETQETTEQ